MNAEAPTHQANGAGAGLEQLKDSELRKERGEWFRHVCTCPGGTGSGEDKRGYPSNMLSPACLKDIYDQGWQILIQNCTKIGTVV